MKIIERMRINDTPFREIIEGEIFKYEEAIYMKTCEINSHDRDDNDDLIIYNAVNLKNGEMLEFSNFDEVERLDNARLILY